MNKHTPGPWKLYNGYEHKKIIRFTRIGNDVDTVLSTTDPEDELLATNEADLKLIAAAPELLEALEQIAMGEGWQAVLANVVIKKAKGES